MPRLDGTGPMGHGAMTGLGLGRCGFEKNCRCLCCRLSRQLPAKKEITLEDEEKILKKELALIQKKIATVKK